MPVLFLCFCVTSWLFIHRLLLDYNFCNNSFGSFYRKFFCVCIRPIEKKRQMDVFLSLALMDKSFWFRVMGSKKVLFLINPSAKWHHVPRLDINLVSEMLIFIDCRWRGWDPIDFHFVSSTVDGIIRGIDSCVVSRKCVHPQTTNQTSLSFIYCEPSESH